MSIQLNNEDKQIIEKENEFDYLVEQVNELQSLSKITNKVQSVMLDELEQIKKHTGFFNGSEKKDN